MKYVTGCFCCANSRTSLVLQKVTRRRGKIPVVFAFVEEDGDVGAREMTEWFYEKVLSCCVWNNPVHCVDVVQELFCVKMQAAKGEFAALFVVENECFYGWKGGGEVWVLNRLFNRPHQRKLTTSTDGLCVERVKLEPGIVLLVGSRDFFVNLPRQHFREFPGADFFQNNGQADRYLRELAEISTGGQSDVGAAILIAAPT